VINHVTYHISRDALAYALLDKFMNLLGFEEVEPNDKFEHGYQVRWFRERVKEPSSIEIALGGPGQQAPPLIHFVADGASCDVNLGLGHFCVTGMGEEAYQRAVRSDYCVRESGSGRAWMMYNTVRAEIRP
jgi:hypothetical protein